MKKWIQGQDKYSIMLWGSIVGMLASVLAHAVSLCRALH